MALNRAQAPVNDLDATYDSSEHRYVPTLDLILRRTNVNLNVYAGSTESAEVILDWVSEIGLDELKRRLPNDTRLKLEYKIVKDLDARRSFLNYLVNIVRAGLIDGGWLTKYTTSNSQVDARNGIAQAAIDSATASGLLSYNYSWPLSASEIHVGY
jgi:hypothetical protein